VVAPLAARSLLCPFTNDTKTMHLVQQGDRFCVGGECRALTRRRAVHEAYSAVSYDKTRSLRHGSFRFLNRQPRYVFDHFPPDEMHHEAMCGGTRWKM
jgi:hypothetical protein